MAPTVIQAVQIAWLEVVVEVYQERELMEVLEVRQMRCLVEQQVLSQDKLVSELLLL